MIIEQRTALSSYLTRLLSTGRVVFSREEAQEALGVNPGAFLDAAGRQQHKQHLISPGAGSTSSFRPNICLGRAAAVVVHRRSHAT